MNIFILGLNQPGTGCAIVEKIMRHVETTRYGLRYFDGLF